MHTLVDVMKNAGRRGRGIRFVEQAGDCLEMKYDELYDRAGRQLKELYAAGVEKGDEVILQMPDNCSFVCAFWACILGGIVAVPVPVAASESEYYRIYKIWHKLRSPKIITTEVYLDRLVRYVSDLGEQELAEDISKRFVNCEELKAEAEPADPEEVSPEDIAYLQFSSGSTFDPKGIRLTHGQIIANLEGIISNARIDHNDSGISWLPLTHDMGMVGFHLAPTYYGLAHCLIPPAAFVSDPIVYLKLISEYKYTITGMPNFGYGLILKALAKSPEQAAGTDLSSLRLVFNGAEPISVDMVEKFCSVMKSFGLKRQVVYPVYGLAEAVLAVAFPDPEEGYSYLTVDADSMGWEDQVKFVAPDAPKAVRVISEGQAVKHCSIKIGDRSGRELADGYAGEIMIKGKNITEGYYDGCNGNLDVLDSGGWYKTGDIGFIKEGNLYVAGRIKDIIFSNGRNYYSHDIERCMEREFPHLTGQVVACGVSDKADKSDSIVIFVLSDRPLEQFAETARLISRCIYDCFGLYTEHVIPTTDRYITMSGKLQRFKYVSQYTSGVYSEVCAELEKLTEKSSHEVQEIPEAESDTECALRDLCRQTLDMQEIDIDENFSRLGADSLKVVALHEKICERWGKDIMVSDLYSHPTIRSLAAYLDKNSASGKEERNRTGADGTERVTVSEKTALKIPEENLSEERVRSALRAAVAASAARYMEISTFSVYLWGPDGEIKEMKIDEEDLSSTQKLMETAASDFPAADAESLKQAVSAEERNLLIGCMETEGECSDAVVPDLMFKVENVCEDVEISLNHGAAVSENTAREILHDCVLAFTNLLKQL